MFARDYIIDSRRLAYPADELLSILLHFRFFLKKLLPLQGLPLYSVNEMNILTMSVLLMAHKFVVWRTNKAQLPTMHPCTMIMTMTMTTGSCVLDFHISFFTRDEAIPHLTYSQYSVGRSSLLFRAFRPKYIYGLDCIGANEFIGSNSSTPAIFQCIVLKAFFLYI